MEDKVALDLPSQSKTSNTTVSVTGLVLEDHQRTGVQAQRAPQQADQRHHARSDATRARQLRNTSVAMSPMVRATGCSRRKNQSCTGRRELSGTRPRILQNERITANQVNSGMFVYPAVTELREKQSHWTQSAQLLSPRPRGTRTEDHAEKTMGVSNVENRH